MTRAETSKLVLEIDSQGVVTATGNLNMFADAAERARDAGSSVESGSMSADSALNALSLSSLAAAAGVSQLLGVLGKVASSITGFAKDSIQSFSEFEQIQNSLSNVMKSAEKGKELFEDLRKFSFDTTFGVDTLANAAQQLLSTGTAADKLKTRLKQLGDIAGGDTNKFNDLVSIMAKIQNTGKASSMQLQQLALRGVPIYQMLSEMGIEGTATADQIVEAFDRMTSAGGQFYNNMNSINETIQGKEGFISDTWREFLTSFAEASGLADMYKSALDGVYGVLQGVVDWLQKINENPVTQALFKGALIATLGTIAATILGSVIPALVATISKLSIIAALKAAINPVGLAIGAAVAIGTGAIVALGAASDATLETMQGFEPLPDAFEAMAASLEPVTEGLVTAAEAAADMKESLGEDTTNAFQERLDNISKLILQRAEDASGMMRGNLEGRDWRTLDLDSIKKNYQEYYGFDGIQELIDAYNEVEKSAQGLYNATKKQNIELERQAALQAQIQASEEQRVTVAEQIADAYSRTQIGKLEALMAERAQYETMLINEGSYRKVTSGKDPNTGQVYTSSRWTWTDSDEKRKVEEIVKMYDESIASLKSSMSKASKTSYTSWEEVFKDVTGVDAEKYKGKTDNERSLTQGGLAVREYVGLLDSAISKQNELRQALDSGWQPTAEDKLSQERDKLQTLYKTLEELWANNDKITNASEKFVPENNSILQLENEIAEQQEKVWEAEKAAQEEKYLNQLKSLNAELEIVGLTEEEREIRDYINQGYTETQAKSLAAVSTATKRKQLYTDEIKSINEEMSLIGLRGQALDKELYKRQGLSDVEAGILAYKKEQLNLEQKLASARTKSDKAMVMKEYAIEKYQETGHLDKGAYLAGTAASAVESTFQGTDVGTLVEGTKNGGIWAGIIEAVVGAIVKVVKNLDSFQKVANFLTTWLEKLAPLLEFIFDILGMVVDLVSAILDFLRPIMTLIQWVGKLLKNTVGKWLEKLGELAERFTNWFMEFIGLEEVASEQKQEEIDRLKELNKQYQNLSQAIDEQNQYYLKQKELINAQAYDRLLGTPVNDLIITKNGTFSTHPDDTIMAMKHPESLGSKGINVQIINQRGGDTDVSVSQGMNEGELIVTISKKVASDFAQGANGWDSAVAYRDRRQNGRRVMA